MRRRIGTILGLLVIAPIVDARQFETTIDASVPSFSASGRRNSALDANGTLYYVYVDDAPNGERQVRLARSQTNGQSFTIDPFVFNDATSGTTGTLANGSAAAIDSSGRLHVVWGRYSYPSSFRQHYRRFDPATNTAGPIVDLTAMVGATDFDRTDALAIAVDGNDFVWLVTQDPGLYWSCRLWRSAQPMNATNAFIDQGQISGNGFSTQQIQMAVDASGVVHLVFYNNLPPGVIAHRTYDPSNSTFGAQSVIGGSLSPNDYYPVIASDALGNVHCAYAADAPGDPRIEYRCWSSTWGPIVPVTSFTATQSGGATAAMFTIACRETDGTAFVAVVDYAGNASLEIHEKPLVAPSFTFKHDVQPAAPNGTYVAPTSRGTLFPAFNRTAGDPSGSVRRGAAAPFQLVHLDWIGTPFVTVYGAGCPGSGGFTPKLTIGSGAPFAGGQITMDVKQALGGAAITLAFGATQAAIPMGAGCFLNVAPLFPTLITVPAGGVGPGNGTVVLSGTLPTDVGGVTFTTQAFSTDPSAPLGFANSNGLEVKIQ